MQSVDGEAYACRGGEEVVELRLAAQQRGDAPVLVREQRGRTPVSYTHLTLPTKA